ncbi:MAG: hypothetical protein CFE24_00275 [Flavobacterium sp. BFFFF2]|nr:MAG: hypothetical protein CFE24_00275 [Flavobacterium sp. BFFFF2]
MRLFSNFQSKYALALVVVLLLLGCKKSELIPKPDQLIDEEKLSLMMYDLAVIDAIKAQSIPNNPYNQVKAKEFLLRKYQIDSLTYAKSVQYYAADAEKFKLICESVKKKLDQQLAPANP